MVPPYCLACTTASERPGREFLDKKKVEFLDSMMNYMHAVRSRPEYYPFTFMLKFKADEVT